MSFVLFADEDSGQPTPFVWPPSAPYPPLPPLPTATTSQPGDPQSGCWSSHGDYVSDLPFTPPAQPDKNYRRGNFQLKVPGFTYGYNDKDRSIVMTWEAPSFTDDDQQRIIDYYKSIGLTHYLLSVPQARNFGVLDRLPAAAERAANAGLFVVMAALGGDGESFTRDVVPVLNQMRGMLTELCVAWQIDAGNKVDENGRPYTQVIPDLTLEVSAYAKPKGLLVSQHWINGACALWPYPQFGIANRFDYGRWAAPYVDCQYLQIDTEAAIDDTQSAAAKVLEGLSGSTRLCYAEGDAQSQYDNPWSGREPYDRLKGYLMACARRSGRVMDGGYFDRTARLTGEVL
jgi:hypothetical protein